MLTSLLIHHAQQHNSLAAHNLTCRYSSKMITSPLPPSSNTQNPPPYVAATEVPPPAYIPPSLSPPQYTDDERLVAQCKNQQQPSNQSTHSSFRENRWFSTNSARRNQSRSRNETQSQYQSRNLNNRSDEVDPYATATYHPRPQSPPSQTYHPHPKPAPLFLNTASSDSSHSQFSRNGPIGSQNRYSQLGTPTLENRGGGGWGQGYGYGGMHGKPGWATRTPGGRRQLSRCVFVALAFFVGVVVLAVVVVVEKRKQVVRQGG